MKCIDSCYSHDQDSGFRGQEVGCFGSSRARHMAIEVNNRFKPILETRISFSFKQVNHLVHVVVIIPVQQVLY